MLTCFRQDVGQMASRAKNYAGIIIGQKKRLWVVIGRRKRTAREIGCRLDQQATKEELLCLTHPLYQASIEIFPDVQSWLTEKPSFFCQIHARDPSIFGILTTDQQPLFFHALDCFGNRANLDAKPSCQ